jgi:flagellar hook-length control protein FliK
MQILPLINARAQAAADSGLSSSTDIAKRQSALFASMLDSARTNTTTSSTGSSTSSAASSTIADPLEASAAPSEQDLMTLPLTKEDLAALHDDLKQQGFSDEELASMDQKVASGSGMTWGEMMSAVKKKVSTSSTSSTSTNDSNATTTGKKEISTDDTTQLLGLFGKLGFTTEESQKLVDSLSKGDTQSVLAAIDAKVAGLSADSTVSLGSSEIAVLGKAMNLSDAAQQRLTALFDQSNAAQGLSGAGLTTAVNLVKNELLSQINKENQALAEFRDSTSQVLAQAWQRESGKLNADMHQDDVARKAAQVVAMGAGKQGETSGVPTASQSAVNVLGDVPQSGKAVSVETAKAEDVQTALAGNETAQTTDGKASVAAELTGRAGAVAAEQAVASGQITETKTGKGTQDVVTPHNAVDKGIVDKSAVVASQGTSSEAGMFAAGQQGGHAGGTFEQSGQDGGWGEFWNKVRTDKTAGATTTSTQSATTQTSLAAMDAVKTASTGQTAQTVDAGLASRVARQLETGILRNVGQDAKQLTLTLSPEELGKLNVTLTVKDKEVRATISAENPDTAAMLQEQAAKIKQTLEDQGFKVTKLDVQTGLAQDNTSTWQSPEQHNQAREQREAMERIRASVRLARDALDTASDIIGDMPGAMTARAAGLDIIA